MKKIVRTPTRVTGGITAEEKVALDAHAKKWIANAMSTEPVAPDRLVPAIKALYAAANLKEPRVVIVPSPVVMAFAGGFAAAIWWVRKNNSQAISDRLAWRVATRQATDQATDLATRQATDLATRQATRQATYQATDLATDLATRLATDLATRQATYLATGQATDLATDLATRLATDLATRQATDQATYLATRQATDLATRQATRQATYQATDLATDLATRLATDLATGSENLPAQFSLIAGELGNYFGVDQLLMLRCANNWYAMAQGGNMWSAWDCYLTSFRDVLGLVLPEHDKYKAWEACAVQGGYRIMHEEFCIVSDRPEVMKVDERNRPHCADGPSHRWRDGWSLYHWHGVLMPKDREYVVHSPNLITARAIETEENSEIRRVMIDRYGSARYVSDSGATVVHELPADHAMVGLRTARLLYKDVPGDEPIVYVDLLNSTPEPDGTVKRYMLRVDPDAYGGDAARNCHAAAASTWRNADGSLTFADWRDYAPTAES